MPQARGRAFPTHQKKKKKKKKKKTDEILIKKTHSKNGLGVPYSKTNVIKSCLGGNVHKSMESDNS